MNNLRLRKATVSGSEFAYRTKKAAFREYVEKVWGWDGGEQRLLHKRRFVSQDSQVIQMYSIDVRVFNLLLNPF